MSLLAQKLLSVLAPPSPKALGKLSLPPSAETEQEQGCILWRAYDVRLTGLEKHAKGLIQ